MEQPTTDDVEQARDSLQAILAGIARGELAAAPLANPYPQGQLL